MPSPFPGMNPYLEQEGVWHGFHQRFITAIADALVPQVRPTYIVHYEQHVYLHERAAEERLLLGAPDVSLARGRPGGAVSTGGPRAAVAAAAPVQAVVPAIAEAIRESYLEVRDRERREVVTVIEVLSPTNKKGGPDRDQYLAKRREFLAGPAHVVEIDLLRGWPRMPIESLPDCQYYAMVARAEERPRVGVWPVRLREPLPSIPVPLRAPDADAALDLQALLHQVYDAAGFGDYVYDGQPTPPLHPADMAWAAERVPRPPSARA